MNKLPQITLAFWVMKICATTLGETAGDLLSMTLDVGYAISSMILVSVFLLTLVTQLFSKRYNPVLYWIVILSTSTAGTTMSDFMDRTLGLGFAGGALLIGSTIAVVVALKYFTRISSVLLFWVAFVLTRPFGATLGDFLTKPHEKGGLDFGTIGSSAVLAGILLVMIVGAAWAQNRYSRQSAAELS